MIFRQNYCFFLKEVCFLRNFQLFKDVTHTILSVDHTKMDERIPHAIIIDRGCDIVSSGLDVVSAIAHCHTDTCLTDDRDIVASVAKGHCLLHTKMLIGSHGQESFAFVGFLVGDVHEVMAPAAWDTMRNSGHESPLFFLRNEGSDLHDTLRKHVVKIIKRYRAQSQSFAERCLHDGLIVINSKRLSAHNDSGTVKIVTRFQDALDILGRNHVCTDRVLANKAVGTIGGDIAVDEMLDLAQVENDGYRASGRDENLHAARLCLCECIDRRLRYAVSAETHQRTINIEK